MLDCKRSIAAPLALAAAWSLATLGCGPSTSLEKIEQMQARGAYAQTIEPLRELIATRPGDAEVLYRYGLALSMAREYNLAHWSLRLAMEDPEWLVPAGLEMAAGMLNTGNYQEAIDTATRVLEADPQNVRALLLRAQAQTESNLDHEAAVADARRVHEIDPDNMDAVKPLVLGLLSLNRGEEAGKVIADLGKRLDEADADEETTAWHCATTAIFADESGEKELAETRWKRCLEQYPGVPNVVVNGADFYSAQGDIERRTAVLRAAVEADPDSRQFRLLLAGQLRFLDRADEADALLLKAAEGLDPAMAAQSWTDLAKHRQEVGDFAGAAEAMDRAVEGVRQVNQPWAQLLFDQADALLLAGEYDRALAVASQMHVAAHATMIRARVAQERGNYHEALELFDEAFALWPDNPFAFYYAALAAESVGEFERALESYRAAIRLAPAATDARTRAARYQLARGRPAEAFTVLRFKADTEPLDVEGEILSDYLWARAGQKQPLMASLRDFAEHRKEHLPHAVATALKGSAERSGPAAAVELLRTWQEEGLIDPTDPAQVEVLQALVRFANAAGSLPDAEATVRTALAAHPKSAALYEVQGWARELAGAPEAEVRAAYNRALDLDPDNARAHAGLGRLARGGDPEAALAHFDRAVAADPESAEYARTAAELLIELGRGEEAEARLDAVIAAHPMDAQAAEMLAVLRMSRGDSSDRTLELASRAALMGRGPDAFDLISRIYEQRNEPEPAQRAAEQAREMRKRIDAAAGEEAPHPS